MVIDILIHYVKKEMFYVFEYIPFLNRRRNVEAVAPFVEEIDIAFDLIFFFDLDAKPSHSEPLHWSNSANLRSPRFNDECL